MLPPRALAAIIVLAAGCGTLRNATGREYPLTLQQLTVLSVQWHADSYGREYLRLALPQNGYPCAKVSDTLKLTLAGNPLELKERGGLFFPRNSWFTPDGCKAFAEFWITGDGPIPADAPLVVSDGTRSATMSGPGLFQKHALSGPTQVKVGAKIELAMEPRTARLGKVTVGYNGSAGHPPGDIDSVEVDGAAIRFVVPDVAPGPRGFLVQISEYELPVSRCEGVPSCRYTDGLVWSTRLEISR